MVMDATQPQQPSPQSVGREFVRQYYTLLNKAPNHLHRFYNNNSSFVHGESTLVIGQKNIHNRIQQLNFHDCHAKISQVDAQATLGNGVVVQVTGELSNGGQPMRRFTQTFVLAAQSPKKYYVHNDIFRYQDMYTDDDNDAESRSEIDEENDQAIQTGVNTEQIVNAGAGNLVGEPQPQLPTPVVAAGGGAAVLQQQQQPQVGAPQQPTIYYSIPTAGGRPLTVLAPPPGTAVPLSAQFAAAAGTTTGVTQQVSTANVAQLNGAIQHDEVLNTQQQQTLSQSGSPHLQGTGGSATVVTAVHLSQPPVAGVVPVASANSGQLHPFQQTPLMQQQMHQPQQQPLSNNNGTQQNMLHSQLQVTNNNVDVDENLNNSNNSMSQANMSGGDNSSRLPRNSPPPNESVSPMVDDFKTINEQQQQEKYEAAKQQQNEPKTYANLFKSSNSTPGGFVNAVMQQQQQIQQQQQPSNSGYQTISTTTFSQSNTTMSNYNNRNNNDSLRSDNMNSGNQLGGPMPQRNSSRLNKDFERRTSNSFGDNQQLFLGNIPHHATEDDLKMIFARFGNIIELRILTKPTSKIPSGVRNPLNYGFITYEDAEAVQNCLSNGPLYYPENSPDGQKLNVEEKKPRMRPNDMPPRSLGPNMNMNNSQRNMGGPPSRSLSNSGGGGGGGNMMRGNNSSNNMSRGTSGPRIGGGFNRNDRGGPSNNGGPQMRGGNNGQPGGSYSGRR